METTNARCMQSSVKRISHGTYMTATRQFIYKSSLNLVSVSAPWLISQQQLEHCKSNTMRFLSITLVLYLSLVLAEALPKKLGHKRPKTDGGSRDETDGNYL